MLLDRDDAVGADLVDRLAEQVADLGVPRGDSADLSDGRTVFKEAGGPLNLETISARSYLCEVNVLCYKSK